MKWVLNTYQTAQNWSVDRIVEVCQATGYAGVEILQDFKQAHGLDVIDPEREQWMLRYLARANRGPLSHDGLEELFRTVLDLTKRKLGGS